MDKKKRITMGKLINNNVVWKTVFWIWVFTFAMLTATQMFVPLYYTTHMEPKLDLLDLGWVIISGILMIYYNSPIKPNVESKRVNNE